MDVSRAVSPNARLEKLLSDQNDLLFQILNEMRAIKARLQADATPPKS